MRALAPLCLAACLDPLAPVLHEDEVFLCDDTAAWAHAVEGCLEDCAGMVSFTGTLDGFPIAVTSEVTRTELYTVEFGEAPGLLDRAYVSGTSEWFRFTLRLYNVGSDTPRLLALEPNGYVSPVTHESLVDDIAGAALRLDSVGNNVSHGVRSGGLLEVDAQTPDRIAAHFEAEFGPEAEPVRGCFEARATERFLTKL